MTWEEFKRAVEEAGIKDGDPIWYIDVGYPEKKGFGEGGRITVFKATDLQGLTGFGIAGIDAIRAIASRSLTQSFTVEVDSADAN